MKRVIYILATISMIALGATSCVEDIDLNKDRSVEYSESTVYVEMDGSDAYHGYGMPAVNYTNNTDPAYVPADQTTYSVVSYRTVWWSSNTNPSYNSEFYAINRSNSNPRLQSEYDNITERPIPTDMTWAYNTSNSGTNYGSYVWHLNYSKTGSNSSYNDGGYSFGRYAYIADPEYMGILQPADVDEGAVPVPELGYEDEVWTYPFVQRNPAEGQGLWNMRWMTVFIYPAIPMTSMTNSSQLMSRLRGDDRILVSRMQEITVSEPFEMDINGYGIVQLPDHPRGETLGNRRIDMHDLRSKILVNIVRDADLTSDFTVTNLRMRNAGYWGWFHPLMKYTDISYYDDEYAPGNPEDVGYPRDKNWIYVGKHWAEHPYNNAPEIPTNHKYAAHMDDFSEEVLLFDSADEEDPTAWNDHDGTEHLRDLYVTTEPRTAGSLYYTTGELDADGIYLFANDYTTGNYLTPSILLTLNMGSDIRLPEEQQNPENIASFRMNIPLTMSLKPGYQYKFKLNVTSTAVRVTFQEKPWYQVEWNDNYLGIDPPSVLLGVWEVKDWIVGGDGNGGDTNIGL